MRRLMTIVAVCCFITVGAAIVAQEKSEVIHSWVAPREAEARHNPLPDRPEIIASGRKVFQQRCSACHAEDGTGTDRGPNLTIRHMQDQTDGALFWKISSGNTRKGMPTFSFLSEVQRWQLVMHVRALTE